MDGQQRITTLYGIVRGHPPNFFDGNAEMVTRVGALEITLSFVPGQLGTHSLTAEVDDAEEAHDSDEVDFEVEVLEAVWLRVGFESNPV